MRKSLLTAAAYLAGNSLGLLLAVILLEGFRVGLAGFVVAVVIFTTVQALLSPLFSRLSREHVPQLLGGIALVVVFVGLFVTQLIVSGMEMGGLSNWLAATLLVWLGSLLAQILLPIYVFPQLRDKPARSGS